MRFLIDADLPRRAADVLRKHGHAATDVRDIGLGAASDAEIAAYASANKLTLLSGDFGFADIRNYPPAAYAGIIVLELPRNASSKLILDLIDELLQHHEILASVSGSLAIVEPGRIRIRS